MLHARKAGRRVTGCHAFGVVEVSYGDVETDRFRVRHLVGWPKAACEYFGCEVVGFELAHRPFYQHGELAVAHARHCVDRAGNQTQSCGGHHHGAVAGFAAVLALQQCKVGEIDDQQCERLRIAPCGAQRLA